jgi:heat shock protein HslJ
VYNNFFTSTLVWCALAAAPLFAQSTAPDQLSERRGIEHRLVKLTVAGEEIALPQRPAITLTFLQGNRVAGVGPVNLFFGGYHLADDGTLHWAGAGDELGSRFGSTVMAGPEDLMNLEKQFFQALGAVSRLEIRGTAIVLDNTERSITMLFEGLSVEQTANSLMGVRLRLTRLIANGSEITIPRDVTIVLAFTGNGRADGFSGINVYQGSVQFPALGQVQFPSMFVTTRMSGPEPVMMLERAYLEALSTVKRWRLSLNGAVMTSENAFTIFEFSAIR